jgi:hypothetical protein
MFRKLIKFLLATLGTSCLIGCAERQHPWTRVPAPTTQPAQWTILPASKFPAIHWHKNPEKLAQAVAVLADQPAAEISDLEVAALLEKEVQPGTGATNGWSGPATTRPAEGEHAYLVRGVAYGGFCFWCRLWIDSTGQSIWVHQGTSDGENLLVELEMKPEPAPVIVFLPNKPSCVYVTALLGG